MSKLLLLLSFMSLVILAIGTTFFANYPLFQLASSSSFYEHIIEILASILFLQLITHPPRHLVFRVLSGLVAISIGGWTIAVTYASLMPLLDTLSLLASAAAIGVTALEVNPESVKRNRPEKSTSPLIA